MVLQCHRRGRWPMVLLVQVADWRPALKFMMPSSKRAVILSFLAVIAIVAVPVQALSQQITLGEPRPDGWKTPTDASLPDAPEPLQPIAPIARPIEVAHPVSLGENHKFWDRENQLIFGAVAASSTADFFV